MTTKQKLFKILILEDNIEALLLILEVLNRVQEDYFDSLNQSIAVTILSEVDTVERWLNNTPKPYDLILLDRDTLDHDSFHIIDFAKYSPEKTVGISAIKRYNEELKERGVTMIIDKNLLEPDIFQDKLFEMIEEYVFKRKID